MALANAVVDKSLDVASQHSHGKFPINLEIDRAFEEKFDPKSSQFIDSEIRYDEIDPEPASSDEL